MSNPISLNDKQTDQANLDFNNLVFEPLKNHEIICKSTDFAELVSWDVDKSKDTARTSFLFVGGPKEQGGVMVRENDQVVNTSGIGLDTAAVYRFAIVLDKEAVKAFIKQHCPAAT